MPAVIISTPFFLLAIVFGYLTLEVNEDFAYGLIPAVIVLAAIYTLSPQVNWWWYKQYPPKLDQEMRNMLIKHHHFYNSLSVDNKKRFRDRMALYMIATEFTPKGWEAVPEDIKGIIAANVIYMTFNQVDFLLPKFERIIIYTSPFPSPQYPQKLHASELYEEDGVLLFSAQQIFWTFLEPQRYYNLILHEFIKAFQYTYPTKSYPLLKQADWSTLERISQLSKDQIEGIINLEDIDPSIISGTLYFTHPQNYQRIAPDLYKKWGTIFKN